MTTQLEKLPGEPIIVSTVVDYEFEIDGVKGAEATKAILEQQPEPVIFITNALDAHMGFEDIVKGVNLSIREFDLAHHPKVRETILVTADDIINLAAKGLESPIFGQTKLKVFKTLDDALAYARKAAQS
jgi:hypothetical protein